MAPQDEDEPMLSDEEYLISRAREELKRDPFAARAWMLTAKSLFSNNFNVQFEAYNIEKATKHVKEAAHCFSTIFQQFEHEPLLWQEVQALTLQDSGDPEAAFLKEMFSHIPQEVQQSVLVATAERSEDTMEQCRLLLLLLRKFPHTAPHHAPKLVELLLAAERHCTAPVNLYRQFLVCQVLPLIGQNPGVKLSQKLLFRLLHKSIDFYCSFLISPSRSLPEGDNNITDPWQGLFAVQELLGRKLEWSLSSPSPNSSNKEAFWQKLQHFSRNNPVDGALVAGYQTTEGKELVYCGATFLLLCLHEYAAALAGTLGTDGNSSSSQPNSQQDVQLVLVEAFVGDPVLSTEGPAAKKSRGSSSEEQKGQGGPTLSVSAQASQAARQSLVQTLMLAARTWNLVHCTEYSKREFARLQQQLRLNEVPWLQVFLEDEALLRGCSIPNLSAERDNSNASNAALILSLRLASTSFCLGHHVEASQHALDAIINLPLTPVGQLSGGLRRAAPSGRHLHFLALTRLEVLQYCAKLLLTCLQRVLGSPTGETALGHCLVLLQLDWPQEQELATLLLEQVRSIGRFSYPLFSRYVVNVDLLEELMFLASDHHGGRVILDILPATSNQLPSQRRIATRGVDKGAKEDFRQAMRRQMARGSENIEGLIQQFLTNERASILQAISARI